MFPDTRHDAGFLPSACSRSMRHGDFSTICVMKSGALYMSVLNICDIPYSVKIVSMLNEDEASVHTYTSEKFDKPIQITRKYFLYVSHFVFLNQDFRLNKHNDDNGELKL